MRAIVRSPQAFLFDEPLSNLDAKLRIKMRTEIKKIYQRVQTTVVYVTHDQVEAMTLADRIVVMNAGILEQVGTPQELYDRPANRFVAGFIGAPAMNLIPCRLSDNGSGLRADLDDGLSLPVPEERRERYRAFVGRDMIFGIRPEHVTEKRAHTNDAQVDFSSDVEVLEPMGMDTMVFINIRGEEVCARVAPKAVGKTGERMEFTADMNNMHLIDPSIDLVV